MNVFRHWRYAQSLESCLSANALRRKYTSLAVKHNNYTAPPFASLVRDGGLNYSSTPEAHKSAITTRGLIEPNNAIRDTLPEIDPSVFTAGALTPYPDVEKVKHNDHTVPPFPSPLNYLSAHKSAITTRGLIEPDAVTRVALPVSGLPVFFPSQVGDGGLTYSSAPEAHKSAITTRGLIEPIATIRDALPVPGLPFYRPYIGPLEKGIMTIYGNVRSDDWRARMLNMLREVAYEEYDYPAYTRRPTNVTKR